MGASSTCYACRAKRPLSEFQYWEDDKTTRKDIQPASRSKFSRWWKNALTKEKLKSTEVVQYRYRCIDPARGPCPKASLALYNNALAASLNPSLVLNSQRPSPSTFIKRHDEQALRKPLVTETEPPPSKANIRRQPPYRAWTEKDEQLWQHRMDAMSPSATGSVPAQANRDVWKSPSVGEPSGFIRQVGPGYHVLE